jgi:lysozyme
MKKYYGFLVGGLAAAYYFFVYKKYSMATIINKVSSPIPTALNIAIAKLKELEGITIKNGMCRAYWDVKGYAIGYGNHYYESGKPVGANDTITAAQAENTLTYYAQDFLIKVKDCVKVPVTANQLASLTCFAYNEGIDALRRSTLLKLLNSSYPALTVANEFDKWVYAGGVVDNGLVNRRKKEKSLFLS